MSEGPDVYAQAYSTVENVEGIVGSRIASAMATSEDLSARALDAISDIKNIRIDHVAGVAPLPASTFAVDVDLNLPEVAPTSFGSVKLELPSEPSISDPTLGAALPIPTFASSVGTLTIPAAPAWVDPGASPARPSTGAVTLPTAPVLAFPDMGTLSDITIPTFQFPTMPTFSATAPEFEGTPITDVFQWTEPTYRTIIIDEVVAKLRDMWDGKTGLPVAVEQALFDRAAEREDYVIAREVDKADIEISSRGITTADNGARTALVKQIRTEGLLKKQGLNRDISIKVEEWHIENLRHAVTQGIAAENVYVNLFLNAANRLFEAEKFRLTAQMQVYGAQVTLFNALQEGRKVEAEVYKAQLQAALAPIEVFKAQIEGAVAQGKLNEQQVAVYKAKIDAVQSRVEVYKTQMEGAKTESAVIQGLIEAYKADIQAYAEKINAQKIRFDAYDSQVKAEASKAGIMDAEAKAYSALVQGISSANDIVIKRADVQIETQKLHIQQYVALLEARKDEMQAQLAAAELGAKAYIANTQRLVAESGVQTEAAKLRVSVEETKIRTALAYYDAQVKSYIANMEQSIRKANIELEAAKSVGGLSSTMAAGAWAGVNVGANLSGNGQVSASGSQSNQWSDSRSRSENYNYNYTGT